MACLFNFGRIHLISIASFIFNWHSVVSWPITEKQSSLHSPLHIRYSTLSEKWIVKRSRFRASCIASPQSVAIFAISHLLRCIKYYHNSLEDKVDKSAVATSYQVDWIGYTLQNILGHKFFILFKYFSLPVHQLAENLIIVFVF